MSFIIMQQVQPHFIMAHKQSQQAWIMSQQALSGSGGLLHQLDVLCNVVTGERQDRWQERLHRSELKRLGAVL